MTDDNSGREDDCGSRDAQFFEAFPDPAVRYAVRNGTAEIRSVNGGFESMFDVDEEEAIGSPLEPYLHSETVQRIPEAGTEGATESHDSPVGGECADEGADASGAEVLTALRSETEATVIIRHDSNGEQGYFQLQSFPVRDTTNEAYLLFTDVTNIQQRACRWQRSVNRLEHFASVAAHDIRNPLEVADIRLEAARDTHEDIHFEKVAGSLDRIQQIVEDVLSVGGASIEPNETVGVGECAEAAWDTVDTADATLTVATDRSVRADRSRLQQLFENLFRNAVEHDGRDVTVTVGSLTDGFYVTDNGSGIPEAEHERVFEAGYSMVDDNTGLGLAIVEQITEAHDWRVRLTTADSGGARFEFTEVQDADGSG